MKKPALPDVPTQNARRWEFDARIKEMLEILTGRRGGAIKPLKSDASQADIIDKVNEIIARLQ